MARFASHASHRWDGRSARRSQSELLAPDLHCERPALRTRGICTLSAILWTIGYLCMHTVAARDTTNSQWETFPSFQSGAAVSENLFTPATVRGKTRDCTTGVHSTISSGALDPALGGWELKSKGRTVSRLSKRPEGKTNVQTSPASARNAYSEVRPSRFERGSRRTHAPVGQEKRPENKISLPLNNGNHIVQEKATMEKAAVPDNNAKAESRETPRGLRDRMLQRKGTAGNSSSLILPHVNIRDMRGMNGRTEYIKNSDEGVPIGNLLTAPGVKRNPEYMSATSRPRDSRHTARAREVSKERRQAVGSRLNSGEFGKGPWGKEGREETDLGPDKSFGPRYDVVIEQNTSARKDSHQLLGEEATEALQVRHLFNKTINNSLSLKHAEDKPHRAQGHSTRAEETRGTPVRRLAGDAGESGHPYVPAEQYTSVEGTTPGNPFVDDEGLVRALGFEHSLSYDVSKEFQSPSWYDNSHSDNPQSSSKSLSLDDAYEWEEAFSLDPGFRYPRPHRLNDSEREKDLRRPDDGREQTGDYAPSAQILTAEENAIADEFNPTEYFGQEPGFDYSESHDYLGHLALNGTPEESGGDDYEITPQNPANPEWGFAFASGSPAVGSPDDLEEMHDDIGGEEPLFSDSFEASPYEAAGYPHVQHFGAHSGYSLEEDSSGLKSAAPGSWPNHYDPYADDSSGFFDNLTMQPSPRLGANNSYEADSSGLFANLDTETPSWSNLSNYYAHISAGRFGNVGAQTPTWSSPYNHIEDTPPGPWHAQRPSWSSAYQFSADTPSGHFDNLDAHMPSWSSNYNDYEENPSRLVEQWDVQALSWPSPYDYSTDDPSAQFDNLGAQTPSWSGSYSFDEEIPSRYFEHWDTQTPSWPDPYRYDAKDPSRDSEPLESQTPFPFSLSFMHYDSPVWENDYGDNAENSFSDDFVPTAVGYPDYAPRKESFYSSRMPRGAVGRFPGLAPDPYGE